MGDERSIRIAQSCAADPRAAAEELHGSGTAGHVARALLLLQRVRPRRARGRDRRALRLRYRRGLHHRRRDRPMGCRDGSLTGVSFAPSAGAAVVGHLDDLQGFSLPKGVAFASGLRRRLEDEAPQADAHNLFAFLLVDGSRPRGAAGARAPGGPGHPAGRRVRRRQHELREHVHLSRRRVRQQIRRPRARSPPRSRSWSSRAQHFEPTDDTAGGDGGGTRTSAWSDEINGLPAAEEYARMLGVHVRRSRAGPLRRLASSWSSSTAATTCAPSRR